MTPNHLKYLPLLVLLVIGACEPKGGPAQALDFSDHRAQWLQDQQDLPTQDSLFYLPQPAPLFRREFQTEGKLEKAQLIITAAGYYQASINGQPIGQNVLDPAWTDYSKRIYFTEYDITDLVAEGSNCLGVSLGNGFYNPLPLRKWGRRNLRTDTQVGKPTFIAKLRLQYQNGSTDYVVSDTTWTYNTGPLLKNSVYIGVMYDARKEIEAWNQPGFDDHQWESAKVSQAPGGKLQKAFFPPVQVTREITPDSIYAIGPNTWIVDMGENLTGTYRANFETNDGDTVTLRFGERVYEDGRLNPMTSVIGQIKRKGVGGPGAPDVAWQTDTFIANSQANDWFQPPFTYHVFRYMEISGLTQAPVQTDIVGLSLHSNVEDENSFSCASDLLNDIQTATERTFLGNLVSVQSDCPAREKFGYGGDINATSESFIYNYDMQDFYRKTIYDWLDAMNDTSFVDTAPYVGIQYCGISWESACLITQYYLYLYYGDVEIVDELYDQNVQWMEKVARLHPAGYVDSGLSDHESLEPVPVQLTGNAHYLQCARIMETFASLMGDEESRAQYEQLALRLTDWLRAEFWDQSVPGPINRQTLFSTLLYHDVVPADEIQAAKDSLILAVQNGPFGHFNTGIFGTKYALESLSRFVSPQMVFDIVNSTDYPGWGHMIDQGATTIWETWQESDNIYSNSHPMFGSVTEWFYRWLAGIRPDPEHAGFEEFVLAPNIPEGLDAVSCVYHSPLGPIESNWSIDSSGQRSYRMNIPTGSLARVSIPIDDTDLVEITKGKESIEPTTFEGLQTGQFQLSEGSYRITISKQDG